MMSPSSRSTPLKDFLDHTPPDELARLLLRERGSVDGVDPTLVGAALRHAHRAKQILAARDPHREAAQHGCALGDPIEQTEERRFWTVPEENTVVGGVYMRATLSVGRSFIFEFLGTNPKGPECFIHWGVSCTSSSNGNLYLSFWDGQRVFGVLKQNGPTTGAPHSTPHSFS